MDLTAKQVTIFKKVTLRFKPEVVYCCNKPLLTIGQDWSFKKHRTRPHYYTQQVWEAN